MVLSAWFVKMTLDIPVSLSVWSLGVCVLLKVSSSRVRIKYLTVLKALEKEDLGFESPKLGLF